jgi:hypothetical protein
MAIRIETQVSKKIPIPGADFSSRQASITISAEVSDLACIADQARALYAQAEAAVDVQLGISAQQPTQVAPVTPNRTVATAAPKPAPSPQPYRAQSRRSPAPVSEAQLRYLEKLITSTHASLEAILQQYQIGALRDLSSKAASGLIEELRSVAA